MRKISFEFTTSESDLHLAYNKPAQELNQNYPEDWQSLVINLEQLINSGIMNFRYHYVEHQTLYLTFYSDQENFVSLMAPIADVLKLSNDFKRLSIKCMDQEEYAQDIHGKISVRIGSDLYERTKTLLNMPKKS
jgi:hypothetical protein